MVSRSYLDKLTNCLIDAFGDALRAVLLTGSAAVGAFRPGTSDVDVLVAVEDAERAALECVVASCGHEVLACPATKLELVVYEVEELAAPHLPPRWSLNFDTGASTHHVGFDPDAEPSHWFVLDLAFAHRHARPLLGSAAIGDPGERAIERAFSEMIGWFECNEPQAAGVAREQAEQWRETGAFAPKSGAVPGPTRGGVSSAARRAR